MRRPVRVAAVFGAVAIAACVDGFPHLSSTEQSIISLTVGMNPYNFGDVNVGASSMATFTYTPQTLTDDDTITQVAPNSGNCSAYSLSGPPPIPPNTTSYSRVYYETLGSACQQATMQLFVASGSGSGSALVCPFTFTVTFTPSIKGEQDCVIGITYHHTGMTGADTTELLTLQGNGAQPVGLRVTPSSIAFGSIPINGGPSTAYPVTVTNTGTSALSMHATNSDMSGTFLTNPAFADHMLGSGASDAYQVSCDPSTIGPGNATLTFTGTNGSGSAGGMTALSCTGINSNLSITPVPVVFDDTLKDLAPPNKSITITNTGMAGMLSVSLDPEAMGNGVTLVTDPSGSLGAGANATATVHYAAGAEHMGSLGNLVVHISTDGTSNFDVGLNGRVDLGGIATNPATVDFGPLCTGGSASQDVMVYGTAPGTVNLTGVSQPGAPFMATNATGAIMGNHNNELKVTVTATPATTGEFTKTFTLSTNNPSQTALDVSVHATVLQGGTSATPDIAHFGAVVPGLFSPEQQIVLTNCGASDLTVTGIHFEGANPTEFQVVNPPSFPLTVPKTQPLTFNVVMKPDTAGAKSATFVIEHADMTSVLMDGMGIGDSGGTKDRETYYACAVGHSASAWPIALALLALRRRRR